MGLILCPECNAKISDKAIICPQCGYSSNCLDGKPIPISMDTNNEYIPIFKYDIQNLELSDQINDIISEEDNKNFIEKYGNWVELKNEVPTIATVIADMAKKDKVMVAKMDDYLKELIDKGIYRFTIDANGDILPTIRNGGKIVKQVRLEEKILSPSLKDSINNLANQATLKKILDEIDMLNEAIKGIHIELQNDRIAIAESAIDKMDQARNIKNIKLRDFAILNAISTATDAKRTLMRNFSTSLQDAIKSSDKSVFQLMKEKTKPKEYSEKINEAFQSLIIITRMVQLECKGYFMLGEMDSAMEVLYQFQKFIKSNNLADKNTLIILNASTNKRKEKIVNDFHEVTKKVEMLCNKTLKNNLVMLLEDKK